MGNDVDGADEEETIYCDCFGMGNDSCGYWIIDCSDWY